MKAIFICIFLKKIPMKNIFFIASFFLLISCNNSTKKPEDLKENSNENLSVAEKIAFGNGFENWKDVTELKFTFNVDRGDKHYERSWIWNPKSGDVSMMSEKDTVAYNRASMDSIVMQTDGAFINDKYWLLAPFQLVWDEGTNFSEKENVIAPISKDTLNQLTIVYGNSGGYTPGDAYDFFYDKNYKIKEWNYRQGNSDTISMSTTWEDYKKFNGIEIAQMHKDSTGGFKLYFKNISVKK